MSTRSFLSHGARHGKLAARLLLLASVAAAGCGGSNTPVAEPRTVETEAETEPAPANDDIIIPDEDMEDIQRLFERKQNAISRCFLTAIEEGEIARDSDGMAMVALTITTSGAPRNVRVPEMQPKSDSLRQCVVENVQSWTFPNLPKSLDYTFTYRFGTL